MRVGRMGIAAGILASSIPGCFLLTDRELEEHDLALAGTGPDTDAIPDPVDTDVGTGPDTDTRRDTAGTVAATSCGEPLPTWPEWSLPLTVDGGYRVVTGNFADAPTAGVAVVAPTETWIGQSGLVRDQVQLGGGNVPRPAPATDVTVGQAQQLGTGIDYVSTAEPAAMRVTVIQVGKPAPVGDLGFDPHAPSSIAVGDVDGDEWQDLVFVADNVDEVAVSVGNELGLEPAVVVATGVPGGLVRVADLDEDGDQDIVSVDTLGVVRTWSHRVDDRGGRTYVPGPTVTLTDGSAPAAMVSGDFDRDGSVDVAVAMPATHLIHVLRGDGAGGLAAHARLTDVSDPRDLAAVDLGTSGCVSLVVVDTVGARIVALPGQGDGTFGAPVEMLAFDPVYEGQPLSAAVADLDGRGAPDVVAVTTAGHVLVATGAP